MKNREGFLTGLFFILIFFARFLIEFIKEDQEAFEAAMTLNMGQWLSIPFVLAGIFLVVRALKLPEKVYKNLLIESTVKGKPYSATSLQNMLGVGLKVNRSEISHYTCTSRKLPAS